jgi:prepilin-type N-terminal cleavage/methylation domain-containing protein
MRPTSPPTPRAAAGFTLTEMMVAMTLFVLVMGLALNTLVATNAVRQAASARLDIYQTSRSVLELIGNDLRAANLRTSDTQFTEVEKLATLGGSINVPTLPVSPQNGRGRLQINDWPPPREFASMFNADPDDPRVYLGNGIDDDGDGSTDEEAFDGLDNDGDSNDHVNNHPSRTLNGQQFVMADGLDNNNDGFVDEGIDEDIFYPRDMINFVINTDPIERSDLMEVGYALDPDTGRDLLRRSAYTQATASAPQTFEDTEVDGVYPIALEYARRNFVPATLTRSRDQIVIPWFSTQNQNSNQVLNADDISFAFTRQESANIKQQVELVALNILGIDFRAYYHDYAIAEENRRRGLNVLDVTPLTGNINIGPEQMFNAYSFPAFNWDSSIENFFELPYQSDFGSVSLVRVCPNGEDDLAVARLTPQYNEAANNDERVRSAMAKTDGLPRLVQVTLFVADQFGYAENPVQLTTRVFLPARTGDE